MPAPRKYPLELRERAVRMCRVSEPKPAIRRMAEELGVHHEALRGCILQAEAEADAGGVHGSPRVHAVLRREGVRCARPSVGRRFVHGL
ncbi:hypothetical protein GCM10010420_12880 [Streptomyces glaucosporus]|uniref:Transposase n=2 Tax=Streptomyces glaucosporus TaxID=284044 RepID=A0ABP5UYP6_9ACTN